MNKLQTLIQFLSFLKTRKKFWLIPIVLILLILSILLIFAQSSVIAPFIYPLF
ncbi:hypothetical protein KW791_00300 [Candidatus Parcubacteria bacterium]|nr:hypothetical protein [Candidatus Parcubacteria bacterium]